MEKQVGEKGFCVCVKGQFLVSPTAPPPRQVRVPPGPALPGFSPWPVDPVGGVASAVLLSLASEGEGAENKA